MRVLVSYGTPQYRASLELLRYTALQEGAFDRVLLYDEHTARAPLEGCYAWKPVAILAAMARCQPGDLLTYCDSTLTFDAPLPPPGANDVVLYSIHDAKEKDYSQERYTKPSALQELGAEPHERALFQVNAALQTYRVGDRARAFLEEYRDWCSKPGVVGHDSRFPLHRHDQSVLTILASRRGSEVRLDPCHGPQRPRVDATQTPVHHHRRILPPMQTLVVVTPTTGDVPMLRRCLQSVQRQGVVCLRHLVVCDGPEATERSRPLREEFADKVPVHWLDLPYTTGTDRWNGHRIYASAPFLAASAFTGGPADFLAYLDEDNWYGPCHLSDLLDKVLDEGLDAAFSLRMIHDKQGALVCPDSCESLGDLAPASVGRYFLGDTSAWLLRREAAVDTVGCWNVRAREPGQPEADRALTTRLMERWKIGGVRSHSLHYTAGSTAASVGPRYFVDANQLRRYDWPAKPCLYLFHMDAQRTAEFFDKESDEASHLLDEWNINQPRCLSEHFNVIDGFACLPHLPRGATVLVHMCQPHSLPLQVLKDREDLRRLLYTAESPNKRHQEQWKVDFLRSVADDVLTYWKPLLERNTPFRAHHVPHNCHHWLGEADEGQLRTNRGNLNTVGMVLENRTGLEVYTIDGILLHCLDGMRAGWARRLGEQGLQVTVHGKGWHLNGPWRVGSTAGKYDDSKHAVDILQDYAATLVVENTDAEGYVSEKAYDALLAGSVPIFYGCYEPDLPKEVHFNLATEFISTVTPAAIMAKREKVYELRRGILERVGARAYAETVKRVLKVAR